MEEDFSILIALEEKKKRESKDNRAFLYIENEPSGYREFLEYRKNKQGPEENGEEENQ